MLLEIPNSILGQILQNSYYFEEKFHTSSHCDATGYNFTSANWKSADFPQSFTGSGLDNWEVFEEI